MLHFLASSAFGSLLKLVAAIAALIFGVMGVGQETRDKTTGNLNRAGKTAIWGLAIAFLVGATSTVYDFVSGEKTTAKNQQNSERLLSSVRRGIYPFKDVTAEIVLTLDPKFPGVTDFTSRLAHAESDPKQLESLVRNPSPLFPRDSVLYKALRNQSVEMYIFQRVPSKTDWNAYKPRGVFLISNERTLNADTVLTSSATNPRIEVFQRFKLSNGYVLNAQVQSLVDFVPGAIFTSPDPEPEHILEFCQDLGIRDLGECRKRYLNDMPAAVSIKYLTLRFEYPRQINVDASTDKTCQALGRTWLMTILPNDIDDGDQLRKGIEDEQKLACDTFNNGSKRR